LNGYHSRHYDITLIRPPDIPVGGLILYRDSSFFFLSFFLFYAHVPSELAERNLTKIEDGVVRISEKTSVIAPRAVVTQITSVADGQIDRRIDRRLSTYRLIRFPSATVDLVMK